MEAKDPALLESLGDLLAEGPEHTQVIERELLARLQGQPCDALAAFRAFHTLKGIFGFLGFQAMAELTHRAETLMEPYKREGMRSHKEAESLLKVCDRIEEQLEKLPEGMSKGLIELVETADLLQGQDP